MNADLLDFLKNQFEINPLNRLPEEYGGGRIFSDPLIGVARGNDHIFQKFKEVVDQEHMTPLELWVAEGKNKVDPSELRVVSIVFPYVDEIRKGSKNWTKKGRTLLPAEIYCVGRNYANELKENMCRKVIDYFKEKGYQAVAGMLSEAYSLRTINRFYSTWSERHAAFATGLGTFSLHEALITEVGCNVRFASVVTNAPLEITPRKSDDPYANCLYYAKGTCRKCEENCPGNAITAEGHDKNQCYYYGRIVARKILYKIRPILKPHWRRIDFVVKEQEPPVGCGFCQFNVPCMDKNPMAELKK